MLGTAFRSLVGRLGRIALVGFVAFSASQNSTFGNSLNAEANADAQEPVLLWPEGAPGAMGQTPADQPAVWVYPAGDNANGAAIVICPGGGYGVHAVDHEGVQPARWFNSIGVTAIVLRYRLNPYRHPVPLEDAQRAIRWVRANSEMWKVDPARVGIMGFSAGGHLASTAATHFDSGKPDATDVVDRQSSRPDFAVLGYPVVTFKSDYTHQGSVRNLLGESPSPELIENLSNETQVTPQTPPIFFFHTAEDTAVPAQNSVQMFSACLTHGVPAELHVFQHGQHGVGLANGHPALSKWIELCGIWLRQNGFMNSKPQVEVKGSISLNGNKMPWGSITLVPESDDRPVGWSMVMRGSFRIPASAGLVPGQYKVMLVNMGDVAPQPTIDDAVPISAAQHVVLEVVDSPGPVEFDLGFQ